jgi:hypothetical protein
MTGKPKGLTRWDIGAGALLALPFLGLMFASLHAINAIGVGDQWIISRTGIRLYCWVIISAGLTLMAISAPLVVGDLPDSSRLRGWSIFIIGLGSTLTGSLMRWHLLARRNYQHPSTAPFGVMWLLFVAWVILVLCSIYALRLERRAGSGEQRAVSSQPTTVDSEGKGG